MTRTSMLAEPYVLPVFPLIPMFMTVLMCLCYGDQYVDIDIYYTQSPYLMVQKLHI